MRSASDDRSDRFHAHRVVSNTGDDQNAEPRGVLDRWGSRIDTEVSKTRLVADD